MKRFVNASYLVSCGLFFDDFGDYQKESSCPIGKFDIGFFPGLCSNIISAHFQIFREHILNVAFVRTAKHSSVFFGSCFSAFAVMRSYPGTLFIFGTLTIAKMSPFQLLYESVSCSRC